MEKYIFLSYAHKDANTVMSIAEELSKQHRIKFDGHIGASTEYNDGIAEMIDGANMVLAFVSNSYVKSSYCVDEIQYARNQEIPILLIYLEDTQLPSGLAMRLGRFQAIHINEPSYMDEICEVEEVQQCACADGRAFFTGQTLKNASIEKTKKMKAKPANGGRGNRGAVGSGKHVKDTILGVVIGALLLGLGLFALSRFAKPDDQGEQSYLPNQSIEAEESNAEDVNELEESSQQEESASDGDSVQEDASQQSSSTSGEDSAQKEDSSQGESQQQGDSEVSAETVVKKMETSKTLTKKIVSTTACYDGNIVTVMSENKEGQYFLYDYYLVTKEDEIYLENVSGRRGVKLVFDNYKQLLYLLDYNDKSEIVVYEVDEDYNLEEVARLAYPYSVDGHTMSCEVFSDGVMAFNSSPQQLVDTQSWGVIGKTAYYACIIDDRLFTFHFMNGFEEIDINGKTIQEYDLGDISVGGCVSAYRETIFSNGSCAYFIGSKDNKDYLISFDGETYQLELCLNDYRYYNKVDTYYNLVVTDEKVRFYDEHNNVLKEFSR